MKTANSQHEGYTHSLIHTIYLKYRQQNLTYMYKYKSMLYIYNATIIHIRLYVHAYTYMYSRLPYCLVVVHGGAQQCNAQGIGC